MSITDKKESPDARKYAALRELMTEFIGVPTTLGLGLIGEGLAGMIAKKGAQNTKMPILFYLFLVFVVQQDTLFQSFATLVCHQ